MRPFIILLILLGIYSYDLINEIESKSDPCCVFLLCVKCKTLEGRGAAASNNTLKLGT